jgi:hypothetical protein
MIDLYSSIISFIAVTLASTYLVALAYKNTKFVLKHKVSSDMKSIHYQMKVSETLNLFNLYEFIL